MKLSSLQGKVVILEFWATWCAPCIGAMKHLQKLKAQFGGQLVVVAVSREEPERIHRFIANTIFDFTFARHSEELDNYFPHRVIPHTVVLTPQGMVAAITAPGNLDEQAVTRLLEGKRIDLSLKSDGPWDINTDIFAVDSTVEAAFQIQPARPDAPTFSRVYRDGPFQDRRRSFINFKIPMLYREAFNTSVFRMEYPDEEGAESYCVDIIVPEPEAKQIDDRLRDSLNHYFGWKVDWRPKDIEVWVLSAKEEGITLPAADTRLPCQSAGDHFSSPRATMADFAAYLEGFGIAGMPVLDETGDGQHYQIDFSFELENSNSLLEALERMGLELKKERRNVDILVLSPPK